MRKQDTKLSYYHRMQRVVTYIYDNLDRDLSLDEIAEVACLSRYHWHRIYREICGETVQATIRRLRLLRAAKQLIETDYSLEQIAKRAGYQDVSSFSRRFRSDFHSSPDLYRQQKQADRRQTIAAMSLNIDQTIKTERILMMHQVEIGTYPDIKTASIRHKGSYMNIGGAFEKLFNWAMTNNMFTPNTKTYGIYCDDPSSTPEAELNSIAAMTNDGDLSAYADVEPYVIKGGKYAVLLHTGPYAELENVYRWLYGVWLADSGYENADLPCYEEYLNNPREVAPADLKTKIYMPLK